MSRSNYNKPFYVDVGTSMAAIRCASDGDVVYEIDHHGEKSIIKIVEDKCDRMIQEAEHFYRPLGNAAAMCDIVTALAAVILPQRGKAGEDGWLAWVRAMQGKARAALSAPPRVCDVMSLETARKVWFAKKIIPRLDGDLPLGKEVPFEEWFVSQLEQGETK